MTELDGGEAGGERTAMTHENADMQQKFEDIAATFCLNNNVRTINCTPRTMELLGMLQEAYAEGMREGQPKWIPVEERLPEKSCIVICHGIRANGKPTIQMTHFFDGMFDMEDQGYRQRPRVTHWQPLPALPEPPMPDRGEGRCPK